MTDAEKLKRIAEIIEQACLQEMTQHDELSEIYTLASQPCGAVCPFLPCPKCGNPVDIEIDENGTVHWLYRK